LERGDIIALTTTHCKPSAARADPGARAQVRLLRRSLELLAADLVLDLDRRSRQRGAPAADLVLLVLEFGGRGIVESVP
jgi:hypothetical protein